MGYFVSNLGQGSRCKSGRGANPQLDSGPLPISPVTPELILKGVVEKKYFGKRNRIILCNLKRFCRFNPCCKQQCLCGGKKNLFALLPFQNFIERCRRVVIHRL
jgi:hypothetical protein